MNFMRMCVLIVAAALALSSAPLAAKGRGGGILPGAAASDPLDIDAGKLDYFDKEQKLVYSGSVIVVNGPSTLKAARLTILLDSKAGDNASNRDRVKHIDVDGPVTLVTKDEVGTGDQGSYDRAEHKVYLNGNVVWTQGTTITKGDRLVYDTESDQAHVESAAAGGRVRTLLTPSEKKSEAPKDPPPAR